VRKEDHQSEKSKGAIQEGQNQEKEGDMKPYRDREKHRRIEAHHRQCDAKKSTGLPKIRRVKYGIHRRTLPEFGHGNKFFCHVRKTLPC
jgi:hypothetical protein